MSSHSLSDLDQLVFDVRDKTSQALVAESVAAYRGGALRAAIVSTWIAVSFDIIAKVRELGTLGEANAGLFVAELDVAISANNISKLQEIERTILDKAKDDFQMITGQDFTDLSRLRADRHLCAHPAFAEDSVLFKPTPEAVRAHIVHAIEHLLRHAPLQGRSALVQLEADLFSPSFPATVADMDLFMQERYAKRVKVNGVLKLMESTVARVLGTDHAKYVGKERALALALSALGKARQTIYEEKMPAWVRQKAAPVTDERLLSLISFAVADERFWTWLDDAIRARIRTLIESSSDDILKKYDVYGGLALASLEPPLLARFGRLPDEMKRSIIAAHPRSNFTTAAIDMYRRVGNFRQAEQYGISIIIPLAPHYSPDQVRQILEIVAENHQVGEASRSPDIIAELFDQTLDRIELTKEHWRAFVSTMVTGRGRNDEYAYPGIRERLKEHGIMQR